MSASLTGQSSSADAFGLLGRTIDGRYRIDAVVGDGGFSIVYRAYDDRTETEVALKVLKAPIATTDGDEARRLAQREFGSLFELAKYPIAVVRPLDRGVIKLPAGPWASYIAMEMLVGATLDEILSGERDSGDLRPMAAGEVVALLDTAAEALTTAHEIGIAHCDIKPSNLFVLDVPDRHVVKVLDFGIAKKVAPDGKTVTAYVGAFTQEYAAPEQFDEKAYGKPGPWTDVFAFALLIVELMTASPALDGETHGHLLYSAMRTDRRPTPRTKGLKNVSDDVERVFARALAVDPKDRYRSMGDFWSDLKRASAAHGKRISWPSKPLAAYRRQPVSQTAPPQANTIQSSAKASWLPFALIAGVLVLGGGAFVFARGHSDAPAAASAVTTASAPPGGTAAPPQAPIVVPPPSPPVSATSPEPPPSPPGTGKPDPSPAPVSSSAHITVSPPPGIQWGPSDGPAPPPAPGGGYSDSDCASIKTKLWGNYLESHRYTNCPERWSKAGFRSLSDCQVFARCFSK
jgi:eukaryotic-like serine/threonine-protein kinase